MKTDFSNLKVLRPPSSEKNGSYESIRKHDNYQKHWQIGLGFGTLLEGPKRKNKFVKRTFLTSGCEFIHQKRCS